ncbi:hypothetical protein KZ547_003913 [Escherichia coli]|nr:hypothetical protein [Escherichia coli]
MTLEIVPGSLTSPDPSIKNYAPYAPAIGVTGYTDAGARRWILRPAQSVMRCPRIPAH